MARALKTFRYSDGFHAWTVAASSRAGALAAWGVKRDLFKDGSAEEVGSGPDRQAALKAPGELIERALRMDIGKGPPAAPAQSRERASSTAARRRIELLEAELDQLDAAQAGEVEALDARRAALDKEAETLRARQARARDALKTKLKAARAKLR